MLKSALSALIASCTCAVLALLALALNEKPKPPPTVAPLPTPAALRPTTVAEAKAPTLPPAPIPPEPELKSAQPAVIGKEEIGAAFDALGPGMPANLAQNWRRENLLAFLKDSLGIDVGQVDVALADKIEPLLQAARQRFASVEDTYNLKVIAIAESMERGGEYLELGKDEPLPPPQRVSKGVTQTTYYKTLEDGSNTRRVFQITSDLHPQLFKDRGDGHRAVSVELVSDAIEAVRERQGE